MSWGRMFKRANSYAQAKAESELDAHADPRVQVQQAISEMQAHHRDLETAAAHVIAQDKLAKMKLADLSTQEGRYTKSALAAQQQGNMDAARTFATRVASVREQIAGLSTQIPQLQQAANDAKEAVQESADQLQQKVNEKGTILAQVDQTRMQQEMASSMKAVTDLTGSGSAPSFDEIKQKVAGQFAEAQASTELSSASPEVLEMHAHHAELNSEADDILAQLSAGTLQPAALAPGPTPASGTGSTPAPGTGSAPS